MDHRLVVGAVLARKRRPGGVRGIIIAVSGSMTAYVFLRTG